MRSLQDYRNIYRDVASKYGVTGDSVELLVQLLANASYISEVENISYVQEASLERCTLINSKIQHCMDSMYSVFRGRCPRVILRFRATKYMEFGLFDQIVSSNDFNVYYLGYLSDSASPATGTHNLPVEDGFVYSPCKISPSIGDGDYVTVIGLLAKEKVDKTWSTDIDNTYYVEALEENLSNDMYVKLGIENNEFYDTTRIFSEHILNYYIFDLTTVSFGSRLYVADIFKSGVLERNDEPNPNDPEETSIVVSATYYKYSELSSYKVPELKKINISGTVMQAFDEKFLKDRNYESREIAPGVIVIPEVSRDGVNSIHYKANRDRYVSSIIRSNSDVGTVLEETYPSKVTPNGTNYIFTSGDKSDSGSRVDLYYVPLDTLNLLTDAEISEFVDTKKTYYIVDHIQVTPGKQYTAFFTLDLELYKPFTIDKDVSEILKSYSGKFGVNLKDSIDEIKTLVSKVSNVKQVRGLDIVYLDPEADKPEPLPEDKIYDESGEVMPNIYFKVEYSINSIIQTKS